MKSAKVVNKILLISLAFGSATFGIGMLAQNEKLQNVGTIGSLAGVAGALVTNNKKNSDNDREEHLPEDRT